MWPVLVRLGPWTLSTYSAALILGLTLALAALYQAAPPERRARWLDAGLAASVGGLLGARLLYVVVNGAYFGAHLDEALMLWRGGLAWPGAAVGGLAGAWLYTRRTGEPLLPLLDALAWPLAALSVLSWGGCLAAGCAYGVEIQPGQWPDWLVTTAPDLYGLSVPRWPTQAVGLAWSALALLQVLPSGRRRWPTGALGWYALSLVALGPFLLGFLRGDPMPQLSGFRLDVVGSALVLVAATLAWAARLRATPPGAVPAEPSP